MLRGSFNVDGYLCYQPMGATSAITDNSRSAAMNSNLTLNVTGATYPQATASAVPEAVT
jgi:hypothetical protein